MTSPADRLRAAWAAPVSTSERARDLLADQVEANGPAYRNAADSIRAGWSNIWVQAGLAAIEGVLGRLPDEDGD
jgi:hypothetical protein